jgi:guanidinobutyrase
MRIAASGGGMSAGLPEPLGGNQMPRFAGPGTMMRLPGRASADGVDVGFVGIPLDIGTSNRPGTRFGPRAIRAESALIRPYNMGTGAAPFDSVAVADLGDVALNTFDLKSSVEIIEREFDEILHTGCRPLGIGGDHTLVLPVLRAIAKRHGPVALIHVDAHADANDRMFGEAIAHGTPIRRALEEDLINPDHSYQIGLRGSGYSPDDFAWASEQGVRVITAETLWHQSLTPLATAIGERLGRTPAYLSFDIDSLDPAFAPGTGTPEIGGLTTVQALELIRGLRGLELVGADLVEVSPAYDASGNTALVGANLLFELLCVMPGVEYRSL